MVRITPELVENAPQFTNAIKDRELDLRGFKFAAIENLGSTLDQFDTIDLSNNEIRKLDGFPLLKRLKCLVLTGNKIIRLADNIGEQIPYLDTMIMSSNAFSELRELDPLSTFARLTFLSLLHCPVTMRANYRLYIISRIPTLRFLDFRRVTESERRLARNMFKRLPAITTAAANTKSAQNHSGKTALNGSRNAAETTTVKTFIPGAPLNLTQPLAPPGTHPAPAAETMHSDSSMTAADVTMEGEQLEEDGGEADQTEVAMPPPAAPITLGSKRPSQGGNTQDMYAIQEAIKRARSMDEVERLHQMLSSGQFAGFATQWQQHLRQQQQPPIPPQQPPVAMIPQQQQED